MLSGHPHVESYCCREDLPLASQGLKKSHGVVSLDLTFLSVGVKLNSLGLAKEGHTHASNMLGFHQGADERQAFSRAEKLERRFRAGELQTDKQIRGLF